MRPRDPGTLMHHCSRDTCALLCATRPPPLVTWINAERFTDPPHPKRLPASDG